MIYFLLVILGAILIGVGIWAQLNWKRNFGKYYYESYGAMTLMPIWLGVMCYALFGGIYLGGLLNG